MKRSLSHGAKKEYVKPEITRNEPLVDITFLSGTGGSPAGFITSPPKAAPGFGGGDGGGSSLGGGSLGTGGGGDFGGGAGSLTGGGSLLPGTGGAPGTVL